MVLTVAGLAGDGDAAIGLWRPWARLVGNHGRGESCFLYTREREKASLI